MIRRTPELTHDDLARAADLLAWSRSLPEHGLTWDDWSQVQAVLQDDAALGVSA